jgi:hypothetical protein
MQSFQISDFVSKGKSLPVNPTNFRCFQTILEKKKKIIITTAKERKFDKRLSSSDGDGFMPFKLNSFVNF